MADYHNQFFEHCLTYTGDLKGQSVLVVGCGRGSDCRMFTDAGATVAGVDICDDIGADFSDPTYYHQSIEGSDLPGDAFDLVFAIATMEHVGRIRGAFFEMHRLVKPGGWIYSVAAPLWNSYQGHHFECLNPYPWIHLRMEQEELADFGDEHDLKHDGQALRFALPYLFESQAFNRVPAAKYMEAAGALPVSRMGWHALWMDGEDKLTPEIERELANRGYPRDELLAVSHTLVCQK